MMNARKKLLLCHSKYGLRSQSKSKKNLRIKISSLAAKPCYNKVFTPYLLSIDISVR
jgi:hypothetical protein